MKKKSIFIFVLLLICLLLGGCDLIGPGTSNDSDSEYKLIYKVSGPGSVLCEYNTGDRIKAGTSVVLEAIAEEDAVFVEWLYEDSLFFSKENRITIEMTKKQVLTAKFESTLEEPDEPTNPSEPVTPEDPVEVDTHTKLNELVVGTEAYVKATVVATFTRGLLLNDGFGYALVYVSDTGYEVGDVIEFTTTPTEHNGNLEITELKDSQRVGYKLVSAKPTTISTADTYLTEDTFGLFVSFNGVVKKSGSYYNILVGNDTNYLYTYFADESVFHLANLVDQEATFTGYIWGKTSSGNNAYIILTDVSVSETPQASDNTIIAYFDSNWTNPYITLDGSSYKMTAKNGYYEYALSSTPDTVVFYSGSNKTETLDFDSDSYTFVLGNKRYNGLYDGYFTDVENAKDEVKKITTLELNDMHGYIEQTNGKNGISNASYLINLIRNEDSSDNVVLVGNGDMFQGTALSNLTRGRSVVEIMNAMQFDFMGIGNHEFDWGLEEIFKYFDGDKTNGEANFPLINSNIYATSNDKVVSFDGYNILETYMLEKDGLKIGVVSCIGQLKSSILATRTEGYDFKQIVTTATPLCKALRDAGADIIIANLHDGSSSSVNDFSTNGDLSNIQYKGKNLVDVIVNGHTHYNQFGYVEREGADVPVTQAGCNCQYLGELCVYYDTVLGEVVYSRVTTYNLGNVVGTNYDPVIQKLVDEKYNDVKDQVEEAYCMAGETISSKNSMYTWAASVMLEAVGADFGVSNTGGIRSTGNITKGNQIRLENMFMIIPFDNEIILCEVSGANLKKYITSTSNYYCLKNGLTSTTISNTKTYKVAVIDYVYYGNYFMANSNPVNTHVIYRDALIEDLKLRTTFNVSTDTYAVLGNIYKG